MKPVRHARSTAAKHGGDWRTYEPVHAFLDSSKFTFAGVQHRLLLHSDDLGAHLAERVFGAKVAGVPTRGIVEQHNFEDLGFPPNLEDWLEGLRGLPEPKPQPMPEAVAAHADAPAEAAARKNGGTPEHYRPVTEILDAASRFTDHPKRDYALNNSFGAFLCEQILGPAIVVERENTADKIVPVRDVAEDVIRARMNGWIHAPADFLRHVRTRPWMAGSRVAEGQRRRHRA